MAEREDLSVLAAPTLEERSRRIAATRAEIGATVALIRQSAGAAASWRGWVKRHPVGSVVVAGAAGFAAASLLRSGRREGRRASGADEPASGFARSAWLWIGPLVQRVVMPIVTERASAWLADWLAECRRDEAVAAQGKHEAAADAAPEHDATT